MATVLENEPDLERQNNHECQNNEVVLENSLENKSQIYTFFKKERAFKICIYGFMCKNKFCLTDLADVNLRYVSDNNERGNIDLSRVICDECVKFLEMKCRLHKHTYTSLKSFDNKPLQDRIFGKYLAVKMAGMLKYFKAQMESKGCGCERSDCKIGTCSSLERSQINRNFENIYHKFTFA